MKAITKAAPLAALFASLMLGQGFRPLDITPPDPAIMIANQVARLTTLLDLTTAQASQITTILTNTQSAIGALQTTLSTDQTAFNHRLRLDRHRRVTGPDPRCAQQSGGRHLHPAYVDPAGQGHDTRYRNPYRRRRTGKPGAGGMPGPPPPGA